MKKLLLALTVIGFFKLQAQINPQLPNIPSGLECFPDTTGYAVITVGPTGRDYTDVQDAINAATLGTIIKIDPGFNYKTDHSGTQESITLTKKSSGTGWIIIQSARMDLLPPYGERVNPMGLTGDAQFPTQVSAMVKLVSSRTDNFRSEIIITPGGGTDHYWIMGLDMGTDSTSFKAMTQRDAVRIGYGPTACCGPAQDSLFKIPHHIGIDRCYIHSYDSCSADAAIALNGAQIVIVGNYLSGWHTNWADGGYAIHGDNGIGQYIINNNYIESSGINVLFGGSNDVIDGLLPSDIVFTNNTVTKSFRWWPLHPSFTVHYENKNLFEIKQAKRVLMEGNIFENNWPDSQDGRAILISVRSGHWTGGYYPWQTIQDLTIQNNIIRHVPQALSIMGFDYSADKTLPYDSCTQGIRWKISNNLTYDVNGKNYGYGADIGGTFTAQQIEQVEFDHNTFIHESGASTMTASGPPSKDIFFTNNIIYYKSYGMAFSTPNGCCTTQTMAIDTFFNGAADGNKRFNKNLIICDSTNYYDSKNFVASSFSGYNTVSQNYVTNFSSSVGYVDYSMGQSDYHNYALTNGSLYRNFGSDGKDIGVDLAMLDAALNKKLSCGPTSIPNNFKHNSDQLKIFPNPANEVVEISFETNVVEQLKIELYNVLGKKMMTVNENIVSVGIYKTTINLNGMSKGIYFIKANDVIKKLVVN